MSVLLSLPSLDSSPRGRAEQLDEARATYRYSYVWPPEIAVAAEVPSGDSYSARYIAELLPVTWAIFRNTLDTGDLVLSSARLLRFFEAEQERIPHLSFKEIGDWFLTIARDISTHLTDEIPASVDSYRKLCASLSVPACWDCWSDDRTFAWQRLAGANPMTLARVRRLPDHVAVDETLFQRARGEGDSLAAALAEGRLFACDYALLDGAPGGTTHGRQKYVPAPYALFVARGADLLPVAIQLGQRPDSGVAAPGDGASWSLAKLAVQIADANVHETVFHLGRTHMVMEAVTLAMRRQLSSRHPVNHLLAPHCDFTLAINNSAATNLVAPHGVVDTTFGGTIEASVGLVKKGLEGLDLLGAAPPDELASRGLMDAGLVHPYRDDGVPVYRAIRRFVEAYLRLYYTSDAAVAGDVELAAFVDELGANDGGRLRGLRRPVTIDQAVQLLSILLWTASGQHAAVNFSQYPYMGVIPNMVGAFWGRWPLDAPAAESMMVDLLPPYNLALLQLHTIYQLSSVRVNHLGDYPFGHFWTPDQRRVVDDFQRDLRACEAASIERDRGRWLSYPFLRPSQIPASIHI